MKYILAIGNPGSKYAKNYHNLGLICAQWLEKKLPHTKLGAKRTHELLEFEKFKLVKSLVFMNVSFQAIAQICASYKLKPQNFLVMHDELMIPKYELKLKMPNAAQALGNAGHNGLRNISEHIGPNFSRLRIGIDHPKNFHGPNNFASKSNPSNLGRNFNQPISVTDYVLSNIDNLEAYYNAFEAKALILINQWLETNF